MILVNIFRLCVIKSCIYKSDNQTLIIISLANAMITRHNRPCFDYGDRGNEKKLDERICTRQTINQGD